MYPIPCIFTLHGVMRSSPSDSASCKPRGIDSKYCQLQSSSRRSRYHVPYSGPIEYASAKCRRNSTESVLLDVCQEKLVLVGQPLVVAAYFLNDAVRAHAEWALCIMIAQASTSTKTTVRNDKQSGKVEKGTDRWWKLWLHIKWTLGRSRCPPHCEHCVAWNNRGWSGSASSSTCLSFVAVSSRYDAVSCSSCVHVRK